jgi:hypothetical protein
LIRIARREAADVDPRLRLSAQRPSAKNKKGQLTLALGLLR